MKSMILTVAIVVAAGSLTLLRNVGPSWLPRADRASANAAAATGNPAPDPVPASFPSPSAAVAAKDGHAALVVSTEVDVSASGALPRKNALPGAFDGGYPGTAGQRPDTTISNTEYLLRAK